MKSINRRSLLRGAPVAAAAMCATVAQTNGLERPVTSEQPWDKARRLANELSDTLDLCSDAKWMVHVMPASKGLGYPVMFENLAARANHIESPHARMRKAAAEYKKAAMEIDPTCTEWWDVKAEDDTLQMRFMLSGTRKEVQS